MRIIFEDADVLVLDKPAGLLTAGQKGENRETLFDRVKDYARAATPGPTRMRRREQEEQGVPRHASQGVWIIHRLDKDASGLLVFAKSLRAFEWLKNDFKAKRVHRIYVALVEGEFGPAGHAGTVQSFLKEDLDGHIESVPTDQFRGDGPGAAKLAVTHFKVLAVGNGLSLLQVRLETGRKNQIRIHMQQEGHPLSGDQRHGAKTDAVGRLALHAAELGFSHPGTGQSVRYSSPAPAPFYRAVGAPAPAAAPDTGPTKQETAWEHVAGWYDHLLSEKTSDHYEQVILPGVLRLVEPVRGERVLDVACGQGIVSRRLASLGVVAVGVDASPALIEAAKSRSAGDPASEGRTAPEFLVGDARTLEGLSGEFDAAVCVMGLTNIEPLSPVFARVAALLRPGGRFVAVMQHPCFRIADQTAWGWDNDKRRQFRRVDGYLSAAQKAITMNPGAAAAGKPLVTTLTFHRPLQTYARLLGEAGLLIQTLEEWPAQRMSDSGPRAAEENRTRAEIPLFLAWRAIKAG